jgi:cytochrome c biogenesis protein
MGNFDISMRVIDKHDPYSHQSYFKTNLGTPQNVPNMKNLRLVVLRAMNNVQGLGPGVQVQELKGDQPTGEAFWVLKNYPEFDFEKRESSWGLVLESLDEKHFSGLQIAHDPGAPIYWLGCLGMLLGTFYALFVQHRRYHLMFDKGKIYFTGSTNRLPLGFESDLKKMAQQLQTTTSKSEKESS